MKYEPEHAAAFYDAYGEQEWTRFEDGRTSRISLEIHLHYLRRFVRPGDRVLDVGAGPGRFTIELVRLGARAFVADVSPVQLELNRQKVGEAGCESGVEGRVLADVTDLSRFGDASFDSVICYGGPLSYALERAGDALGELLRVTRPGGYVLLSVMSLVGATAGNLAAVVELADEYGFEAILSVLETGDLPARLSGGHLDMHMYRWRELEALLRSHPCAIVAASASHLTVANELELLSSLDEHAFRELVRWEIDLAAEPGALDAGSHIVAVVQRVR